MISSLRNCAIIIDTSHKILIRCALKYNAPLITLDHNLARVAREKGVDLKWTQSLSPANT
jgi:rRNA-processing protein FCF1